MHNTEKIVKRILFIYLFYSSFNVQCSALDYKTNLPCATVKRVFDGDTILLSNNQRIRLLGIDAFEWDQAPYGKIAKDFLAKLVLNKEVCIETDVQGKDIYNRTLGYVFFGNHFVNEELLKNGLAILYDYPPNVRYISRLKKAQIYGRQNKLGVWEKHSYIIETPSQFRHKHPYRKKHS